jgi:putative ABC transport system ATP-binding protein
VLRGEALCYERNGQLILDGVDVEAGAGERIALVGPSGSGKTSLLTLLSGLARPTAGRVLLDGAPIAPGASGQITLVLQGYGLIALLSAAENIEVAMRAAGHEPRAAREGAAEALDELGLTPYAEHLVEDLSGGQQQRVAVARAIALRPRILLADEPTSEQDHGHRVLVMERLLHALGDGSTLVLATHDREIAAGCDRVVELRGGRLVSAAA